MASRELAESFGSSWAIGAGELPAAGEVPLPTASGARGRERRDPMHEVRARGLDSARPAVSAAEQSRGPRGETGQPTGLLAAAPEGRLVQSSLTQKGSDGLFGGTSHWHGVAKKGRGPPLVQLMNVGGEL
jgi:hypothetical protein